MTYEVTVPSHYEVTLFNKSRRFEDEVVRELKEDDVFFISAFSDFDVEKGYSRQRNVKCRVVSVETNPVEAYYTLYDKASEVSAFYIPDMPLLMWDEEKSKLTLHQHMMANMDIRSLFAYEIKLFRSKVSGIGLVERTYVLSRDYSNVKEGLSTTTVRLELFDPLEFQGIHLRYGLGLNTAYFVAPLIEIKEQENG